MPSFQKRPWLPALLACLFLTLAACDEDNDPDPIEPEMPALTLSLTETAAGTVQPVQITHAGDGSGRLFVVERRGTIAIIEPGVSLPTVFLDISSRVGSTGSEQGLLGLAFPPDYGSKGHFYVYYTDLAGDTVVSRFHLLGAAPGTADPGSEESLLQVAQPFDNHNGGQLAFGPDGYLYIGLGDGGGSGNGQPLGTLLGKILRIDVEQDPGSAPYLIPADNPFAGGTNGRDEIWAYGLRNPWRFSFDRSSGDLYIADVGQSRYEEVNFQPAGSDGGENYGWNLMEANHCYPATVQNCDRQGLTLPIAEYDHDAGDCAATGGFVYRGAEYTTLQGIYLYGDFCTGRIWGLRREGAGWSTQLLLESARQISAFGEGEDGSLYVADYATGNLYKIEVP